jgi:hypothetical protein
MKQIPITCAVILLLAVGCNKQKNTPTVTPSTTPGIEQGSTPPLLAPPKSKLDETTYVCRNKKHGYTLRVMNNQYCLEGENGTMDIMKRGDNLEKESIFGRMHFSMLDKSAGSPKTWEEFQSELKKLDSEGYEQLHSTRLGDNIGMGVGNPGTNRGESWFKVYFFNPGKPILQVTITNKTPEAQTLHEDILHTLVQK